MAADVDEASQRLVAVTDEDDRHVPGTGGDERPRFQHLSRMPGVVPRAAEVRSCSSRSTAGSEYQSHGIVRVPWTVAIGL